MDYITTKEAANIWGISDRRVLQYCNRQKRQYSAVCP